MKKIILDLKEKTSFDSVAGHAYENFKRMMELIDRLSKELENPMTPPQIALGYINYNDELFAIGENIQKALYQFLKTNDRLLEMAYGKESVMAIRRLLGEIDDIKIDFISSDDERSKKLKEVKKSFFVHLSRNERISKIADLILEDYWACVVSKRKEYDYVEETMKAHFFFKNLILELCEIKKNTNTQILSVDTIKEVIQSTKEGF